MIAALPASRLGLIDPAVDRRWNEFVEAHAEGMVFHRSEWARVLIEAYGYRPRYHVIEDERGMIRAAWPAMLVDSKITGRRLVMLPFSDHCRPLVGNTEEARLLMEAVIEDAGELGATRIEVRGWPGVIPVLEKLTPVRGYVRHVVDLREGREKLLRGVAVNSRRSLKRAEHHGVTTRLAESLKDLDAFFQLNLKLRRRHGMLPQPRRFFYAIYRHCIQSNQGYIMLAERQGVVLAGLLCLRHNDVTLDKYAVNDRDLQEYRGSHCVMWKAMEMEIDRGAAWYDMGRSDASAQSLHWFKEQWGAQKVDNPYLYHPRPGGVNTEDPSGARKTVLGLFARFAPDPVYRAAGSLAYRHLG